LIKTGSFSGLVDLIEIKNIVILFIELYNRENPYLNVSYFLSSTPAKGVSQEVVNAAILDFQV